MHWTLGYTGRYSDNISKCWNISKRESNLRTQKYDREKKESKAIGAKSARYLEVTTTIDIIINIGENSDIFQDKNPSRVRRSQGNRIVCRLSLDNDIIRTGEKKKRRPTRMIHGTSRTSECTRTHEIHSCGKREDKSRAVSIAIRGIFVFYLEVHREILTQDTTPWNRRSQYEIDIRRAIGIGRSRYIQNTKKEILDQKSENQEKRKNLSKHTRKKKKYAPKS